MNGNKYFLAVAALILSLQSNCLAQQIMIDRGVRAGGLWCFPLVTDSTTYLYLPSDARLGTDEKNQPQFSFLRYVSNEKQNATAGNNTITSAGGGAVLNFLVLYETPEKKVNEAKAALREILNNEEVVLRGPVIFSEGRFALISSIINSKGAEERELLATGNAPVLEGSRIALSFELDPTASKILLESFKMATPDISIVFDMGFSGLTDAYEAELEVNWDDVKKAQTINAGASVYFVSADVEHSVESLMRNNSIKLKTVGNDAKMDGLMNMVYSKVVDLLFQPIDPEKLPPQDQFGLNNLIKSVLDPKKGALGSGKIFGFGVSGGFKYRDFRNKGKSVMKFNSSVTVSRHHLIAFNIGDFYKKYGANTNYFKTVSLYDPDFQQREIHVSVDGTLLPEFDKLINNITVTLRKQHENGETTLREVNITKRSMNENIDAPLIYGSIGDSDREKWLSYEYKSNFQFQGGKSFESKWTAQNAAMINVYTPYERRVIQLDGDLEKLKSSGVRAINVQIEYPFFNDKRKPQLTLRPDDNIAEKTFEITLPTDVYEYNFRINWIKSDGSTRTSEGSNSGNILFIDNMPD